MIWVAVIILSLIGSFSIAYPLYRQSEKKTAVLVALLIPIVATSIYFKLGASQQLLTSDAKLSTQSQQMIERLKQRLKQQPDSVEGWYLLGRVYLSEEQLTAAKQAFARAYQLDQQQPDLLAYIAQVEYLETGSISQAKQAWLTKVHKQYPKHTLTLNLLGLIAYDQGQYQKSIDYWQTLLQQLEPNDPQVVAFQQLIDDAKIKLGAHIKVRVAIARTLDKKPNPSDTVFIIARSINGPKMPLAVIRKNVRDLPVTVQLDDSQAMSDTLKLSQFEQVSISAKINATGNANDPADYEAEAKQVNMSEQANVVILNLK